MKKIILILSLLCGITGTMADIVYFSPETPIDIEYNHIDLNSDNNIDNWFHMVGKTTSIGSVNNSGHLVYPKDSFAEGGMVASLANGFEVGAIISDNSIEWYNGEYSSPLVADFAEGIEGHFLNQRGYVGVSFEAEDGTHYGWMDIEGKDNGSTSIIHGWAYESTPDTSITVGVIPEPSSVALLLVGGMGVWMARRKRLS